MNPERPRISVGLPVYNGGRFLDEALRSLRDQTERDLEIVIADNASTDDTGEICRRHAEQDPRIVYHRQPENIGAGPNYNDVFHRSRGRYFKWAAHDDTMDARLLEVCADRLDAEPDAVLCHGLLVDMDEEGNELEVYDRGDGGRAPAPERFWTMIRPEHNCAEVFGLIRREVLERTQLIRDYTDSDRTLLAQLALAGPMLQDDSVRFRRRMHAAKSDRAYRHYFDRAEWFNPANRDKLVLSATLQVRDLLRVVGASPVPAGQKWACLVKLARHVKWHAPVFRAEWGWALRRTFSRQGGRP